MRARNGGARSIATALTGLTLYLCALARYDEADQRLFNAGAAMSLEQAVELAGRAH
jgi:hypothetical protein